MQSNLNPKKLKIRKEHRDKTRTKRTPYFWKLPAEESQHLNNVITIHNMYQVHNA